MAQIESKKYSFSISFPEIIEKYLIKDEKVVRSGSDVVVDGEKGFNFAITNFRIIFAKERKMHEVRHEHISSVSWERYYPLRWVVIIGLLCIGISFTFSNFNYGDYSAVLIGGLIGIALILSGIFYGREYLAIYCSGRKMKITGKKETLEELMKTALEIRKT